MSVIARAVAGLSMLASASPAAFAKSAGVEARILSARAVVDRFAETGLPA